GFVLGGELVQGALEVVGKERVLHLCWGPASVRSSFSASAASRLCRTRTRAKTISPMTMTMPISAMCTAGPGLAAITAAPLACGSCDVAAEDGEPAAGGRGRRVGDEQGHGGRDRELVFVAGEGQAGAA